MAVLELSIGMPVDPHSVEMAKQESQRPETGAMCFGKDWPGTFIRGDDSFGYAMALKVLLTEGADAISITLARYTLEGLFETLKSSEIGCGNPVQLKPFWKCLGL